MLAVVPALTFALTAAPPPPALPLNCNRAEARRSGKRLRLRELDGVTLLAAAHQLLLPVAAEQIK